MKRRATEDLLVLTKTYDLLLWYVGHIGVLECLTVARYERPNRQSAGKGPFQRAH